METTSEFRHPLAPVAFSQPDLPASSRPHILVLESDPDMRALYREVLEHAGFASLLSATPLRAATIQRLQPDLIVTECRLAGVNLCQQLRQWRTDPTLARIPVVICTGALAWLRPLEPDLAAWGIPVLRKPFDLDHFLAVITASVASGMRSADGTPPEGAALAPGHLARLHDQYVAARWRGEEVTAFGDWLDAHWTTHVAAEPDGVPDAVSLLGGPSVGHGPRWYRRDGVILGFVAGQNRGCYQIADTADPPVPSGQSDGPDCRDVVLRVEHRRREPDSDS